MKRLFVIPRLIGQGVIVLYQRTISPDHGPMARFRRVPMCRFTPTCSQYGYEAIGRYGLIKGAYLAFRRIVRCNPWSPGGHDPVE